MAYKILVIINIVSNIIDSFPLVCYSLQAFAIAATAVVANTMLDQEIKMLMAFLLAKFSVL